MRQREILTEYDPKRSVSITTLAYDYAAKHTVPDHAHGSDQLIYATSGLMEVSSDHGTWLIPPQFALWIPARTFHQIHMPGQVSMRTLYLRPDLAARPEPHCLVLHVKPLLRELIIEAVNAGQLHRRNREECVLCDLLILQLQKASPVPICVAMPRERRALAVAEATLRNPAESRSMASLCSEVGVGARTIQRAYLKDVGTSFESWRRQVRLMKAVELLVSGYSIKEVAGMVGYCQPSAFVEMFRKTFGTTPKAWVLSLESAGEGIRAPHGKS